MNRISAVLLMGTMLAGCAGNAEIVKRAESSLREDVGKIISTAKPPEKSFADLTIRASLKTHLAGIFPLREDLHGTADYQLLVNMDGQPLKFSGNCFAEDTSSPSNRNPEAGMGTRCRFQSHVRVKAGSHRIIVALPYDKVAVEREITLEDSTDNLLEVTPTYYPDRRPNGPGKGGAASFKEGISGVELSLNGNTL
jgi:hypothetical protein